MQVQSLPDTTKNPASEEKVKKRKYLGAEALPSPHMGVLVHRAVSEGIITNQ